MGNILIQYEWNNHKEMNKTKLIDTFMVLDLQNKLRVYRTLKPARKLLLRKAHTEWEKRKQKEILSDNKKFINQIMSATDSIEDFIDGLDIKTHKEILLTVGLISIGGVIRRMDETSSNYNVEQESFEDTKKKMTCQLETMMMRKNDSLCISEYSDLINALKTFEYVSPNTISTILNKKREEYIRCYQYIGVGEKRATELSRALTKRMKNFYKYDWDTQRTVLSDYDKWERQISHDNMEKIIALYFEVMEGIDT